MSSIDDYKKYSDDINLTVDTFATNLKICTRLIGILHRKSHILKYSTKIDDNDFILTIYDKRLPNIVRFGRGNTIINLILNSCRCIDKISKGHLSSISCVLSTTVNENCIEITFMYNTESFNPFLNYFLSSLKSLLDTLPKHSVKLLEVMQLDYEKNNS